MLPKLVVLAAACLALGASGQERKHTIFEALEVCDKYILLWRYGEHFIQKCAFMEVTHVNEENRTIRANISTASRYVEPRKYEEWYFRTYKNGSSFAARERSEARWRDHFSNYKFNYTAEDKKCFVATEVTRDNTLLGQDLNGCELWVNVNKLTSGAAGEPVPLDMFQECIDVCPKPVLSMHRFDDPSYHPNCTYPNGFKPVISGPWQEDLDRVEEEKAEARRQRLANKDVEEYEDEEE